MSQVVEYLAELTGFRDRDVLDVTLVGALKDLLDPRSVAIYRCIGEGAERRWITRARQAAGDLVASADPLWQDPATLPTLESEPARQACMLRQEPLTIDGDPAKSLFPLCSDREGVGVLEVETGLALSDEQMRLVSSILRVYRNFEALLDYSERDTLTGLLNRKTFDEAFMRMTAVPAGLAPVAADTADARRGGGSSAWLGVIDIDHFKRVNDGFGHLIGDEVLLLLSRLMRGSFRYQDRLYRFGGEEFVVLLRSSSHDAARLAFERLRSRVEGYDFPRVGRITISVGVTEVRAGDTPAGAFERADRAVYYAKQNGRNQVAHHAELVASGKLTEESHDGGVELF
ncbi:MAG: GGDEF domain-containing protein [Burkholderiales bacterium]|nr:GGDEF domain-containing protein [Burkholderiales bacterium]